MKSDHFPFNLPSPLEKLPIEGMDLWMKRDDLIHPVVSGNKWRKLKGFFKEIDRTKTIITFGGAYSNHLPATALAAKMHGMSIVGVVRGEELNVQSNDRLTYCRNQNMKLHFIPRSEYRSLRLNEWNMDLDALGLSTLETIILPEGGAGKSVLVGCQEIWKEIREECTPDHLVISSGTGATSLGILSAMEEGSQTTVHVISAVRGAVREMHRVCNYAQKRNIKLNWVDESFGGYGKSAPELFAAMEFFKEKTGISLDRNYNAKLWYWLEKNPLEGQIVWVNTGGF